MTIEIFILGLFAIFLIDNEHVLLFTLAGLLLFVIIGCAPPEFGPEPAPDPIVAIECEMKVVNRHTQDGALCKGDFVATGMVSISPARIQCAAIDWQCER